MKPSSNLASGAAIVACAYVPQPAGLPSSERESRDRWKVNEYDYELDVQSCDLNTGMADAPWLQRLCRLAFWGSVAGKLRGST